MANDKLQYIFRNIGGEFITSYITLVEKAANIKGYIFDWDGVFNNGFKESQAGSPFSEIDSMGLNMLRFSFYLKHGIIPTMYIVTGEHNDPALHLAKREHFTGIFRKAKNKTLALEQIVESHQIEPDKHLAFVFDDILDLSLADKTALRFLVGREANPLMNKMAIKNKWVDYRTAHDGSHNAVREICELLIGLNENYEATITGRITNSKEYQSYLKQRNSISPVLFQGNENGFEQIELK